MNRKTHPTQSVPGSLKRALRNDGGSVSVFMLLFLPVLVLALAAIVDYGAAMRARSFASDAAGAASRAGSTQIVQIQGSGGEIRQPEAVAAANAYMSQVTPPPGVAVAWSVQATPEHLTVTVTATYQPRLLVTMDDTYTRTEQADPEFGT